MKLILSVFIVLSSAVAQAASGGDHGEIPFVVVYQAINVTLLVALLYGLTRKKVRVYFTSRLETHEQAKKSAQKAFADAQERHAEVTKKLQSLHADEKSTMEKAQAEAMLLKSKLIQEAESLATNIVTDAKKTASYEFEKAKQDLRKEAFDLALKLARADIEKNLNEKDQKNLQRQFVDNIGTVQ
ncbi:MAG: ATP synthase F0 subunit B [Bdellovibrionota bacterium]